MFAPPAIFPAVKTTKNGDTRIRFESCKNINKLGPSPQGRLAIMNIQTPLSRKPTGAFQFRIFKDSSYEKIIAELEPPGITISPNELKPGSVTEILIKPSVTKVQELTDLELTFTVEHTLYIDTDITFEFPTSINLPTTGTTIAIVPLDTTADFWKTKEGTVEVGNTVKVVKVF